MLTIKQLQQAVRNNEFLLKRNKEFPNIQEMVQLCLAQTKEYLQYRKLVEALEEIREARKSGKEPAADSFSRYNFAKKYLETSNLEYRIDVFEPLGAEDEEKK